MEKIFVDGCCRFIKPILTSKIKVIFVSLIFFMSEINFFGCPFNTIHVTVFINIIIGYYVSVMSYLQSHIIVYKYKQNSISSCIQFHTSQSRLC